MKLNVGKENKGAISYTDYIGQKKTHWSISDRHEDDLIVQEKKQGRHESHEV